MEEIITLGGKDYRLKYGLKSHFLFESYSGGRPYKGESQADLIMLLYCSLYGYNESFRMDVDQFVELIDDQPEIFEKFVEVINKKAALDAQKLADSKKK